MNASTLKTGLLLGALCAAGLSAAPALAADRVDYVELFRRSAIKCLHTTVNPDKATVEITKGPDTVGEVTTVRLKTFYEGLLRKNVMETELLIRQAGSIRQMKINQLSDSGTGGSRCNLERNWTDF